MHPSLRRPRPPVALTRLIGRERELGEVEALVGAQRLVTLTGMGGTGKTRLAAELALRLDWQRADSVAWVELGASTDPSIVSQQIAVALSLRDPSVIVDALRERELLLVLDNCEHLIDACAEVAAMLLAHCPKLRVMATSREPLGVAGERVWPVPPIAEAEALELFADRASAVDPSFALNGTKPVVAEICRRLDGIPLAIELAAARIRVLTPEQILARLEDRFAILSGGARTTVPRHRTLRAAIDWSFALLTLREQTLLAQLSVFAGSFSLEAVECVCEERVLELLSGLVDKSLVVAHRRGGAVRYSLLESIRQYAAECLGDAEPLRRKHALAFLAIARESVPELMALSIDRLEKLDPDHDNVRAALAWGLEHEPDTIALPLASAFRWYWYYRILWSEGLRWMTRVLERTRDEVSPGRAAAFTGAGTFAAYRGDLATGRAQLEQAAAMWRAVGHAHERVGDQRELALTLAALALTLASAGELDAAEERAAEAVTLARAAGTPHDVAYCLTNAVAFVAQRLGAHEEADLALAEAEAIWSPSRHALGLPLVLNARALLALRRRDHAAAARFAREALLGTRERRDLWFSARALRILAFTTTGDAHRAARLLGAADGMLRALSAGMLPYEKSEHDRMMASLRETLSPAELEQALHEGSTMTFDEACDLALACVDLASVDSTAPQPDVLHVSDLGPLQITLNGKPLVAEGRASNRARELLAFLAAHPAGRTKEEVGVAFWPDATTEQVKNSFHVTLHRLRKLLGDPDAIVTDSARYRLAVPHVADSRKFESDVTAALRNTSGDLTPIEAALSLYEGDYLQGEDTGEWCIPIRAHLRQLHLRGLYALGQALESRGRWTDAADTYQRIVTREPFHEAAWRQLMICRARLGHRSESLLLYRQLEQRLRDDLQTVPEVETKALYQRLRNE